MIGMFLSCKTLSMSISFFQLPFYPTTKTKKTRNPKQQQPKKKQETKKPRKQETQEPQLPGKHTHTNTKPKKPDWKTNKNPL